MGRGWGGGGAGPNQGTTFAVTKRLDTMTRPEFVPSSPELVGVIFGAKPARFLGENGIFTPISPLYNSTLGLVPLHCSPPAPPGRLTNPGDSQLTNPEGKVPSHIF